MGGEISINDWIIACKTKKTDVAPSMIRFNMVIPQHYRFNTMMRVVG